MRGGASSIVESIVAKAQALPSASNIQVPQATVLPSQMSTLKRQEEELKQKLQRDGYTFEMQRYAMQRGVVSQPTTPTERTVGQKYRGRDGRMHTRRIPVSQIAYKRQISEPPQYRRRRP